MTGATTGNAPPLPCLRRPAGSGYGGVHLAELIWPMDVSFIAGARLDDVRAVTLMHESFHVAQSQLGFTGYAGTGSITGDAYLDTQTGRVWLRGELARIERRAAGSW